MSNPLSRREVITIGAGATLLPLAFVRGLVVHTPCGCASDADEKSGKFDRRQTVLLVFVSRTLFPHDFLDDQQYLKIVAALEAKAAKDPEIAATLKAALSSFPDDFPAFEETRREDYLHTLEGSAFFRLVYPETLTGLYSDPAVATVLGDEGSSLEKGGYLKRGFDDISWLPAEKPETR